MPTMYADDPFASGVPEAMITYIDKQDVGRWLDLIQHYVEASRVLDAIDISNDEALDETADRLVRIVGQHHLATKVRVSQLFGGLSVSRPLQLEGEDANGGVCMRVVFKVDTMARLAEEVARYERYVPSMLQPGAYAPLARQVKSGASGYGGAAYSLADQHETLFAVTARDASVAVESIRQLKDALAPWRAGGHDGEEPVREIRRRFMPDDELEQVREHLPLDLEAIEEVNVRSTTCTQHGDLHGLNVLVDLSGRPLVVDFSATGPGPASSDAVQLELSYVFHPLRPYEALPDIDLWADAEAYAATSPVPGVTATCRDWALEAAATPQEVAAVALGWGVRQLKYVAARPAARGLIVSAAKQIA